MIENDGRLIYDEVKGYMDEKSATQLKRMATHYPEIHIRVIDERTYRGVARQLRHWIPGWETGKRTRAS